MTPAEPRALDTRFASELPEAVIEEIASWLADGGIVLEFDAWLDAGGTTAKVGVVGIRHPQKGFFKCILKVCPPDRHTAREPRSHAHALRESPLQFRDDHLVDQPLEPVQLPGKWWLLFQSVAGGSLRELRPMSAIWDSPSLPDAVGTVVLSVLKDWNPDPDGSRLTISEYLAACLDTRAEQGGPVDRWIGTHIGNIDPWIFLDGKLLPNPASWLRELPNSAQDLGIFALLGKAHGDLHLGNILIPMAPVHAAPFRLIDLSGYTGAAPLARDPMMLMLSIILRHLTELAPLRREELLSLLARTPYEDPTSSLSLQGRTTAALRVRTAGLAAYGDDQRGLRDDWMDQTALALSACALSLCTVDGFSEATQAWLFKLACHSLNQFVDRKGIARPDQNCFSDVEVTVDRSALGADTVLESCNSFFGGATTIAVFASAPVGSETVEQRGLPPWDLVIDFDPATDRTGSFHFATARSSGNRLVTVGQIATFGRHATTWFAAGGLDPAQPTQSFLDWRRTTKASLETVFKHLARSSTHRVTLLVLGQADDRIRTLVDVAVDVFDNRLTILEVVESQESLTLDAYQPIQVVAPLPALLRHLPTRDPATNAFMTSIPGADGPLPIEPDLLTWFEEIGDLLHSGVGRDSGSATPGDSFFRGRAISWFELDLLIDVPREDSREMFEQLRLDLTDRNTRRINFQHFPGAGGTTVARRIAWDARLDNPTYYIRGATESRPIVERVQELARRTGLSVLVIFELTSEAIIDRIFSELRIDSTPAVLLITGRRTTGEARKTERSFYLGALKSRSERTNFADYFAALAPMRADALYEIATHDGQTTVPFLFGLIAFEKDFVGVTEYVGQGVKELIGGELDLVVLTALAHRYSGRSVPTELFNHYFGLAPDVLLDTHSALGDSASALLIAEEDGTVRTLHWVVAEEILRQTLRPGESPDPDSWSLALSNTCVQLIDDTAYVYGDYLPNSVRDLLDRLFITRDNQRGGIERVSNFSELLQAIPSVNGRLEVLTRLAETFPEIAHYWAHLGRLLSNEVGDFRLALNSLNRAIDLDDNDDVLFHMRGVVYRNEMKHRIEEARQTAAPGAEAEVLELAEAALRDFIASRELDHEAEYGAVATIQLACSVLEFGKRLHSTASYGALLASPSSVAYRRYLDEAEESLRRIEEVRGSDQWSQIGESARAELMGVYDDFGALLQGLRNLLVRPDIVKAPVRRRLARAYEARAGGWRAAPQSVQQQAFDLLTENLIENPADGKSLIDWLRVARFVGVSLDRAAELVSYSASTSREAAFYDYVIAALLTLEGRDSRQAQYATKVERSKDRASGFPNRRHAYEWLGHGIGLAGLIHHSDLRGWDRRGDGADPEMLRRVEGRIVSIDRPQVGEIEVSGMRVFFTPAASNLVRGRDENRRASFLLGFSYEGPRAWSVKLSE